MSYNDRKNPITHELNFPFLETSAKYSADPSWNYDNNGTDWTEGDYANSAKQPESPIDIATSGSNYRDWASYQYSFLPSYVPTAVASEDRVNYTYTVVLAEDAQFSNGYYGSEPVATSGLVRQLRFKADKILFKYPAEHTYKNTTAYMEMQVFHQVSKFFF